MFSTRFNDYALHGIGSSWRLALDDFFVGWNFASNGEKAAFRIASGVISNAECGSRTVFGAFDPRDKACFVGKAPCFDDVERFLHERHGSPQE